MKARRHLARDTTKEDTSGLLLTITLKEPCRVPIFHIKSPRRFSCPLYSTMRSWTTVVVLAGLSLVQGLPRPSIPRLDFKRQGPIIGRNGDTLPPYDTVYHFDQLIDHGDPSKGNFKQRYWTTWEFYKKGGPIILMIVSSTCPHLVYDIDCLY